MNNARDMKKENDSLKKKIKTKQNELIRLKSTFEKDVTVLTKEMESIDTKLKVSVEKKMKVEEEIRKLQEIVENCNDNIRRMEQERKTKEGLIEATHVKHKAAEDHLTEELKNLDNHLKALMRQEIAKIKENIKRKRGEIENDLENLDALEVQLKEPKRGKLTGEYIEYMEPDIKMEIKLEDTDEELE